MSVFAPIARPRDGAGLDAELLALELDLYVSLDGLQARAHALERRAHAAGDRFAAARAVLALSDAHSRWGRLEAALAEQRAIADRARTTGEGDIEARARCYLASTFMRLGLHHESQEEAAACVTLLGDAAPAHWQLEHEMVFVLLTSYDRAGVEYEMGEDLLRRTREFGEPTLLLALLNNFAWTTHQDETHRDRARELVDEMTELIDSGRAIASGAVLDTVAWIRLADGRVDEAERLLERAISIECDVEPDTQAAATLHLAEIRRRQQRPDLATALCERARAIASATGVPEFAVEALPILAELDAERGDFRRAYRRMRRYVDERAGAERSETQRRAAILQALHATQLERDRRLYFERLAVHDALTGLHNRRHLEQTLPGLLADGVVTLALVDVDHFKRVNDEHSHEVGDAVLVALGRILEAEAERMSDRGFAARLGGEEFVLVITGTPPARVRIAIESLRATVAGHDWSAQLGARGLTISAGVTSSRGDADTLGGLLGRADALLYRAKREGRDRVVTDVG